MLIAQYDTALCEDNSLILPWSYEVIRRFSYLRQFAPAFLRALDFKPESGGDNPCLEALVLLSISIFSVVWHNLQISCQPPVSLEIFMDMKNISIFLASSSELKKDRENFEIAISRKNNDMVKKGMYLQLVIWENFLDAMSKTRLQDEYNNAIRQCDIFVMLFSTKVGKYTTEEFETAFGQFKEAGKPLIFTYFKDIAIRISEIDKGDLMSLWAFKEKLNNLGHFYSTYENIDELTSKFDQQLNKLQASMFEQKNFAGQWTYAGNPQILEISVKGNLLTIDMSEYGRPEAKGEIDPYDPSKATVNFPDDRIHKAHLKDADSIEWLTNGTYWKRKS